jgi:cellulose synthase/poly-beta-1,6-N-acetylglucosamine synthase-like glycosyltransferase
MRKGQNPAKFVQKVAQPQRITVAVLNYVPFLSGFYAQTLDILKLCLGSIWENSDLSYDLLVFDNGSCQEVVDYLTEAQDAGKIQYLILSEKNMGKGGAWNIMLQAAPGEIVAYTDNDAYFYPALVIYKCANSRDLSKCGYGHQPSVSYKLNCAPAHSNGLRKTQK